MTRGIFEILLFGAGLVLKTSLLFGAALLLYRNALRRNGAHGHLALVACFLAVLAIPLASRLVSPRIVLGVAYRTAPDRYAQDLNQQILGRKASTTGDFANPSSANGASNANESPTLFSEDSLALLPVAILWASGFLFVACRFLIGMASLGRMRRKTSVPFAPPAMNLEALASRAGVIGWDLRRTLRPEMTVPITWGTLRPMILLPVDAETWPESRFEAVLLHELAHIKRRDFFWQSVAEFVCAIHWFNPLAWKTSEALRSAAETAADDSAVRAGILPSDYATELLQIATRLGNRKLPLAYIGTPAMKNSQIESRVEAILLPKPTRRGSATLQVLAFAATILLAVPVLASLQASTQTPEAKASDRTIALSRIKQVGLATLMYSQDYDGLFPYAQSSAQALNVEYPYYKNKEITTSPTPGGKFVFNSNLPGVNMTAIPNPAQTPMWYEVLLDKTERFAAVYTDGHAKLRGPDTRSEFEAALKEKFARDPKSKPLPKNYLITWK